MALRNFEYVEPASIREACRVLGEYPDDARIYAGGTSLLLLMKQGIIRPRYLVNIKKLPGLRYIENGTGVVRIGALTTHHDLERSPLVSRYLPVVAEAEADVANIRVRSVGTVGGNLGFAEPQTDLPPLFMALDARIRIESATAARVIPLGRLFVSYYQTVLEPDELIAEIQITVPPTAFGLNYQRFSAGSDKPAVGCAVSITLDASTFTCTDARIVLGCVAPTPLRVGAAEELLSGREFDSKVAEQAAQIAADACSPLDDVRGSAEYKRTIVKVLTGRAIAGAFERAKRNV